MRLAFAMVSSSWTRSTVQVAAVDESVTEFMVLYQRVRAPAASTVASWHSSPISTIEQTRRLDTYRKATDSFASSAAQVVGAVVATVVVTIASGGTLGPIAVGAMAAVERCRGVCRYRRRHPGSTTRRCPC